MIRSICVRAGLWAAIALAFCPLVARAAPSEAIFSNLAEAEASSSYERAKLAFDRIIDPDMDEAAIVAQIDQLAAAAKEIAAGGSVSVLQHDRCTTLARC